MMSMVSRGAGLLVAGALAIGSPFSEDGQSLLYGTAQKPIAFALGKGFRSARLVSGQFVRVEAELSDPLWKALGTASGDLASEWMRLALNRRVRAIERQNELMEARGELLGPWEAMSKTRQELAAQIALTRQG